MPFDFVKTQKQKDKHDNFYDKNTLRVIFETIKQKGFGRLYVGWQFRIMQYLIQSIFTVVALEKLEMKAKTLN